MKPVMYTGMKPGWYRVVMKESETVWNYKSVLEAIDPHDRFMGYLRDDLLANFDNVEKQWWWR